MNTNAPQHALREWRQDMQRPETLAVLAGVSAVLAVLGPYDTLLRLPLVPRALYWLAIVVLTYSAGHITSGLVHRWFSGRIGRVGLVFVTSVAIGSVVTLVVLALNLAVFQVLPDRADLAPFLFSVFTIAVVISLVFDVVERRRIVEQGAIPPPLLDRLPLDKRGPLVALSVQDHYVLILTTKGSEMVLMRLTDAIREVGETPGLQVHRSHWVAISAIAAATRRGDRGELTMTHGPNIPVSRANLPKLREAGLLPR